MRNSVKKETNELQALRKRLPTQTLIKNSERRRLDAHQWRAIQTEVKYEKERVRATE